MQFVADENVSHRVVERLRADGHDVMLVAEMRSGMPDTDVLKLAIPKPAFWSPRIGTLAS